MITILRALGGAIFIGLTLLYGLHGTPPEATAQIGVNIVATPVNSGLSQPVHITHAGDGSGRLFVVEQAGRIRVIVGGVLQPTPFLDITGRVKFAGEEGLLSAAFPPGFSGKRYFYVYYTNLNGDNRVSRFHLDPTTGLGDPTREDLIIYFNHPTYANHNGGQTAFGPDGFLYIGTGDGGGGGDPLGNAQNPGSLLGKVLRIAVEPPGPSGVPGPLKTYLPLVFRGSPVSGYSIPPDNPFVNVPGYRPEIWALGLRNPWRFSFDRQTGDLYIGDVGQGEWEEVNFQPAGLLTGRNYGWNIMEGAHCYLSLTCNQTGLTLPVAEYPHTLITHDDNGCSITGGFVYRGPGNPDLQGIYFFGDYCTGRIWGLRQNAGVWQQQELLVTAHNISTFGEDEAGNLYYADRTGGIIYRVEQVAP
ncbi:MAG: PQQ-dependent sugar dehydrogenase [Desulfobacterota bacterium]|jgi:glucose/arabinose dehydrogenase|nr:PQQ-dependent sugar dehydrogenase [Thermodesulfobacteriota bacterium]